MQTAINYHRKIFLKSGKQKNLTKKGTDKAVPDKSESLN
jgi:hypothetical protein